LHFGSVIAYLFGNGWIKCKILSLTFFLEFGDSQGGL
jgi:hypothetical protein